MADARSIIIRPIVSERSYDMIELNRYTFEVAKGARKDLGRPKEPPQVNKALYMKTLGSCEGEVVSCEL